MSKLIGGYKPLTPFQTAGSGSARWCIAERGRERFFLKQFLAPVYPAEGGGALARKQRQRCRDFERQKQRLYSTLSCVIGDTLVPVIDFFMHDRRYYAVSEEVPKPHMTGEDVLTLSMKSKREILYEIAQCLQRLHMQGVVHADIKPDHVLMMKMPVGYHVKLIDLDSGFLADDPPTSNKDIEGDPVYLAPETFLCMVGADAVLDTKIDTFAFAIMLHRLWTGELPEIDHSKYAYIYEAALDDGDILLSDELPAAYHSIVKQMLSKNSQDRPDDALIVQMLYAPYRSDEREAERSTENLNGLSRFMKRKN